MRTVLCCVIAFLLFGCEKADNRTEGTPPQQKANPIQAPPTTAEPEGRMVPLSDLPTVELKIKNKKVRLWVANTEETRREGLMFVTKDQMAQDQGMIFVFPDLDYRAFWMKNTVIPLDIAFLRSDGVILNILTMSALDESTYRSSGPAQYAIEMNAGWFDRNGIKAGDHVDLAPLGSMSPK